MNIFEKSNQLAELYAEWFNYRNGLYPSFVTSPFTPSVPEQIPVFSFHSASEAELIPKLQYLQDNKYVTINSDEYLYLDCRSKGERLVMLTFDDGLVSLSKTVYPLLKSFQMKAVAFVLPGEIDREEAEIGLLGGDTGGNGGEKLCTWRQLESMKGSIDIQSHSLFHWLIYIKPAISCFFSPEIAQKWQKIDWPIPTRAGADRPQRDFRFGAPIYQTDSRLSVSERIFEIDRVTEACTEYVEKRGGEEFFRSKGWAEELEKVHSESTVGLVFQKEPEEKRIDSIRHCFNESKRVIEARLGKGIKGFCFPFGIGSPIGERMAAESGYSAVYYGVKANFDIDKKESAEGIRRVTRLKDDYLFRLPGAGRKSLIQIFYEKAWRRISYNLLKGGTIR
jgi:hypothetical protein